MITSTEKRGNKVLLKVHQNITDMKTGESFKNALMELYNQSEREIVLDLSEINLLSSYGIGKILMFYKRLKEVDGHMYVLPLNQPVKEIFEALMLDKLIPEIRV